MPMPLPGFTSQTVSDPMRGTSRRAERIADSMSVVSPAQLQNMGAHPGAGLVLTYIPQLGPNQQLVYVPCDASAQFMQQAWVPLPTSVSEACTDPNLMSQPGQMLTYPYAAAPNQLAMPNPMAPGASFPSGTPGPGSVADRYVTEQGASAPPIASAQMLPIAPPPMMTPPLVSTEDAQRLMAQSATMAPQMAQPWAPQVSNAGTGPQQPFFGMWGGAPPMMPGALPPQPLPPHIPPKPPKKDGAGKAGSSNG